MFGSREATEMDVNKIFGKKRQGTYEGNFEQDAVRNPGSND